MKRFNIIAALLLAAILCSCNSGMEVSDSAPRAPANPSPKTASGAGLENAAAFDKMDYEYNAGSIAEEPAAERKIIVNANMDIEAEDASGLHGQLAARAIELGGYEFTNEVQHHELYSVVRVTFKIPPQNVQAFMAYAGEMGKIVNRSLSSDDVTESYYDAKLRLESSRNSLEQYYRFMDDAKTLDDVLRLQRVIDGIIADIEAFEGKLRMWDVLTDMATVSVYIRQENDPVKIEREINWSALSANDMGYLTKRGFVAVSSGAWSVVQWIFIVLLVTSPIWLIALPVVWFIWKKRKKTKKSRTDIAPPNEDIAE